MSETRTTRHHHTNCAIHGTLVNGKLRDCTCTAAATPPTPDRAAVRTALTRVLLSCDAVAFANLAEMYGVNESKALADALLALSPHGETGEAVAWGVARRDRTADGLPSLDLIAEAHTNERGAKMRATRLSEGDVGRFYVVPLYLHPAVGTAGKEPEGDVIEGERGWRCRCKPVMPHGNVKGWTDTRCPLCATARPLMHQADATPADAERERTDLVQRLEQDAERLSEPTLHVNVADAILRLQIAKRVAEAARLLASRPAPTGVSVSEDEIKTMLTCADVLESADVFIGIDALNVKSMCDSIRKMCAALAAPTHGTTADTERLDWLEAEANDPHGLHLHDGSRSGCRGLGLRKLGRNLREAIDAARSGTTEEGR